MTREEKSKAISELTEKLGENNNFYLTDISGLTAESYVRFKTSLL